MNNKKNNKGFSLVELIVVVAIMAVLVGVLAPAYLKYVENSRVQKDVSAVGEVVQAIKIAAANEAVSQEITTGSGVTVVVKDGSVPSTSATNLQAELTASIGKVTLSSKDLKTPSAGDPNQTPSAGDPNQTPSAGDPNQISIAVSMNNNNALVITVTGAGANADKFAELSENNAS